MPDRKLGLDDLAIGQVFAAGSHVMTAPEITEFAGRYDPQPFHLDDEAARASLFGGLAASGWHTAAVTMRLLVDSMPFTQGIVGTGGEILWPKPVRAGDRLSVETEILAITPSRSKPDRGAVLIRVLTRNQHGEVVQSFTPKLVVMR